jgi:general secretion pathway protein I
VSFRPPADHRRPPAAVRDGFSLLETLVALAVFSLAALALINLAGENARSAAHVETRALATMAADNLAVQALAQPFPPARGDSDGRLELADRTWGWRQSVAATDDPRILRIDVRVYDGADPRSPQVAALTVFRDDGA